jgi:putative tryptophan/tyrosine transport system substrate-binding protein
MRRREFIKATVGAVIAWPVAAQAEQSAMPAIGYLGGSSPAYRGHLLTAFWRGLRESGFVEGESVTIDYRWAQDQYDRLPDLAADLIRRHVLVIAATDTPSAIAAKAATTTLPIVFASGADPIKEGLVASLNRPSGNVTGVGFMSGELGAKQLGLLQRLLPGATRFALLVEPDFPVTEPFLAEVRAAASTMKKQIEVLSASTGRDVDAAFANLAQKPVDALLVGPSLLNNNRRVQLITLAAYHKVPAIYSFRESAEAGGLMSYGANLTDAHHQLGIYAGRILKGQKPADLPIVQSARFEFVINLNTARAFGLNIPPELLATADEVIE